MRRSEKELTRVATNRDLVIDEVIGERRRQDSIYGKQTHLPEWWYVILGEEVGEVARAIYDGNAVDYRRELVQVAAVAIAMVESFDTQKDEE